MNDLAAARALYVDMLKCRPGRVRKDWLDVWFFGLQLTLQERPDQVQPIEGQGVRHFGVSLDRADLAVLLRRLEQH